MAEQMIQQTLVHLAKAVEDQIDDEMSRLDNLTSDDIEGLRAQRIKQLRRKQAKSREWIAKGHGQYRELLDEKEFFAEMKGESKMVCHFYRENWPCKVMDKHLAILTQKHLECKFVKINAEKSPFLVEKLKIWMLPTLALISGEKVNEYIVGFDEFGGKDDFPTEDLANRLVKGGMLTDDSMMAEAIAKSVKKPSVRKGEYMKSASDEDSDLE